VPSIRHLRKNKPHVEQDPFHCPECGSSKENRNDFCLPCDCPDQIPQPSFPSANSSFSQEELEEVTECIEQANELLLTLGVEREEEEVSERGNLRTLQENFRKLRHQYVTVIIKCEEELEELEESDDKEAQEHHKRQGCLIESGLDFLILETDVGNFVMIPFERIITVIHSSERVETGETQELLFIDPCLRRDLTFHFGKVVSNSPFLLNIFFGIELKLLLGSYIGCFAYVKAVAMKRELDGIILDVNHKRILLEVDREKQGIDFDEICFIEIEREVLARDFLLCNPNRIIN
jgi:hypothetical protein